MSEIQLSNRFSGSALNVVSAFLLIGLRRPFEDFGILIFRPGLRASVA
jgi:hypothetical protein